MRLPRLRKPELMDVIRIDGQLRIVTRWEAPTGWGTEPLAEMLASRLLLVGPGGATTTLGDALIEAGWTPPDA